MERVTAKDPPHGQEIPAHLMAQVMAAWLAELDAEQDRIYEAIQARKSATRATTGK